MRNICFLCPTKPPKSVYRKPHLAFSLPEKSETSLSPRDGTQTPEACSSAESSIEGGKYFVDATGLLEPETKKKTKKQVSFNPEIQFNSKNRICFQYFCKLIQIEKYYADLDRFTDKLEKIKKEIYIHPNKETILPFLYTKKHLIPSCSRYLNEDYKIAHKKSLQIKMEALIDAGKVLKKRMNEVRKKPGTSIEQLDILNWANQLANMILPFETVQYPELKKTYSALISDAQSDLLQDTENIAPETLLHLSEQSETCFGTKQNIHFYSSPLDVSPVHIWDIRDKTIYIRNCSTGEEDLYVELPKKIYYQSVKILFMISEHESQILDLDSKDPQNTTQLKDLRSLYDAFTYMKNGQRVFKGLRFDSLFPRQLRSFFKDKILSDEFSKELKLN